MKFAFLIHPRDHTDVYRKFKIARFIPKKLLEFWCLRWPPVLISKVTGLKNKNGEEIQGWIISLPMTAKQMIEHRKRAQKRIIQAIKKAERLGAKIVGLGALTSSVTAGGELIRDKINIRITPGHAFTSYNVSSNVLKTIKDFGLKKEEITLAIVGAAGAIGSNCAKLLTTKGIKKILLIDLKRKNNRLNKTIETIQKLNQKTEIVVSHHIRDIKNSEIIIAATSAPEALILPQDLMPGAIIVDDAQPTDISPEVLKQRDDVLVIDGGVLSTPNVNCHFNMGLAKKNDIFSCLGETLIIAGTEDLPKYRLGELNNKTIEKSGELAKKLNFKIKNYQRQGKIYPQKYIDNIKNIWTQKASS